MKCPRCQFENREGAKFCQQCGIKLELTCPSCGYTYRPGARFCDECGQELGDVVEAEKTAPEAEGERKYVTVLFSDLSGYTAMSEKLDPEEVKEIMSRIFGEIAQVVTRYEGFIEKFIGDAVVAIFGVPKAHEDDPVRAIRAARRIHELVTHMSPQLEQRIGRPLSMHSGVNSGLVVTGKLDQERGMHEVTGDAINVASRLGGLARAGEILAGLETYRLAEGHFTFEVLEPTRVKGKEEPLQVFKVLAPKEIPETIHRLSGLRARLIGRKAELSLLDEVLRKLGQGKGAICVICGDAGTGKSRLVEEFKATLNLEGIQWIEGHAYPYSQNIPYFLFLDLLNRAWGIEEGDPPERVREKVESNLHGLMGPSEAVAPYIGGLYALSYPEVEGVSPEFWKSRLFEATKAVLGALANRAPTIVLLEDIHWADPSSLELLRFVLEESGHPAIFLCVYRPHFGLLTSHQAAALGQYYREIKLQDLSPSETQDMVLSLLQTDEIPAQLKRFIQEKVEGNPFYLEEVVNSLIEAGALAHHDDQWRLTRPIEESDIPSTIQGVISARLDRLETEMKRVLQEASVIGRAFLYEILKRITELKGEIDRCLGSLERLDLIRMRSFEPHLEYIFKHALTQEAVYNGLLKKERKEIHERIALAMEELFQERLSEFYETLAFHFKQGLSLHKAVRYLVKSGEKGMRRYAVEESHQYFQDAYNLIKDKPDKTKEEEELLVDVINQWCVVFYYRGDFRAVLDLLSAHEEVARSLEDKAKSGMFYAWFGMALYCRERFEESHEYLSKALELGELLEDHRVLAYACTWLSWCCGELGLLDEAICFGKRGHEIAHRIPSEPYPFFKSLGGLGYTYWHRGDRKECLEVGRRLLEYGHKHSNARGLVMGHWMTGLSHLVDGDFLAAAESSQNGVRVSKDPFYYQIPRTMLGGSLAFGGRIQEAEEPLNEVLAYSREFGAEIIGTLATMYLGIVSMAKGHMTQGLNMLEEARKRCLDNHRRGFYALTEYVLGRVHLQIVEGAERVSLPTMAKNIGFLVRTVPFAGKKAEEHFTKAIEVAKEIGVKGILGMAHLDLGALHRAKGRKDKARECISTAIQFFEQCEAETYLKQAKEALASLE